MACLLYNTGKCLRLLLFNRPNFGVHFSTWHSNWQGAANIQLFPEIFSFFSNFSQLNCLYFIGIMYLCTK